MACVMVIFCVAGMIIVSSSEHLILMSRDRNVESKSGFEHRLKPKNFAPHSRAKYSLSRAKSPGDLKCTTFLQDHRRDCSVVIKKKSLICLCFRVDDRSMRTQR